MRSTVCVYVCVLRYCVCSRPAGQNRKFNLWNALCISPSHDLTMPVCGGRDRWICECVCVCVYYRTIAVSCSIGIFSLETKQRLFKQPQTLIGMLLGVGNTADKRKKFCHGGQIP